MNPRINPMNPYETDELLGQYLEFHFGAEYFGTANYPAECAAICQRLTTGRNRRRALDLGCAVGRTAFELARSFDHVDGVDLSNRFIAAANTLKQSGAMDYFLRDEGDLGSQATARLAGTGLTGEGNGTNTNTSTNTNTNTSTNSAGTAAAADRTHFIAGDACNLPPDMGDYDLIFAGNLIDRLHDPAALLGGIHHRLASGGTLVISSPYTLLEEYTPRANWLGGYTRNGTPRTVLHGMHAVLDTHFALIQPPMDVPFVIRETRRKFQHTVAELTAWRKRT